MTEEEEKKEQIWPNVDVSVLNLTRLTLYNNTINKW